MTVVDAAPKCLPGLDISPADDGFIIYQPELDRVHYLNHSAVLILELCTGGNSLAEISRLVQEAYGLAEPPDAMVRETVVRLGEQGLFEAQ